MNSGPRTRTSVRLAIALATSAGMASALNAQTAITPTTTTLKWSSGQNEIVRSMSAIQLNESIAELSARPNQSRVLVHLEYQVTQAQRAQLAAAGLHLTTSLGSTSFLATLDQDADAKMLSRSALASINQINPTHKLHRDLQSDLIHPWMLSQDDVRKHQALRELSDAGVMSIDELQAKDLDPSVAVIVMFHTDADRVVESARLAQDFNGQVLSQIKSVNSIVIAIKADQIKQLAADDAVMWVEPPLPAMQDLNSSNRALVGANTLNSIPYSLDGSGVTVLVYDGGKMFQHNDFGSRLTIGATDTAGISDHATHVGGTIGGDGTGNINNRGMAPGVDFISFGFEQDGGLTEGFLYTDPGDIEADYTSAILTYNADIANNSIGTNTAPNGYPCDWTGNYNVTSALIDTIAKGSINGPFRIVWANGNERQVSRCTGDDNGNFGEFFSTAPPACAKNHITVGSVDSDTDFTSSFSSWGPTDDGRIKPDISAPGCQSGGDGGVTSTSSSGGYNVKCGTSMAAPTVTGVAALILEQYRITFPDRDDLMNATLKALFANTAEDRGNTGPDYKYGYGSIRGIAAIDTVIAENIIESEVSQGGTYAGIIIVGAGETELKATIAWDDAPAAPAVTNALVNDLDLRIIDPLGNVVLPWTLDPSNPNGGAVQSVADHLNNIEQVSIMNPIPGAYTVEVSGFNIPVGPSQTFGLVTSTTLINCSSAGLVSIGGNIFSCEGATTVKVVDCDLNTSDLLIETVDVLIDADSNLLGPLTLTLTETAAESATFTASFTFSESDPAAFIHVNEGDSLTATYIDADNGNGTTNVVVMAAATIDCVAPTVQNVTVSNIEPRAATVNVDLDEAASVIVNYGTSIFSLNDSVSANALMSTQALNITGLIDQTTYVFTVQAQDQAGNMSTDDNGGVGYTFTTPDIPDFFTEEFNSGLDLEGLTLTLTPSGTAEDYTATIEPLAGGVLPYEPTDGSIISLGDDDSDLINISGGNTVLIYGQAYGSFYVGSNGYVTFGSSDTDYTESLSDHFDTARVSILFDDLNPSSSGTVYQQQLADRMIISYDNVTEYSNTNNNTMQIELHFDGTIVLSWENIDSGDAICGISAGNGQDPDFFMSDLSTYQAPSNCPADINGDGTLNFFDVSAFLTAFNAQDPAVDFNSDGQYNFFDVSAFLNLFDAGCP